MKKWKKQLIEAKLKMIQMLQLTEKYFKSSIISMSKELMINSCTMSK